MEAWQKTTLSDYQESWYDKSFDGTVPEADGFVFAHLFRTSVKPEMWYRAPRDKTRKALRAMGFPLNEIKEMEVWEDAYDQKRVEEMNTPEWRGKYEKFLEKLGEEILKSERERSKKV